MKVIDKYGEVCYLTKREYFAGLAMQGYIAGVMADPNRVVDLSPDEVRGAALGYADGVLAGLEDTK